MKLAKAIVPGRVERSMVSVSGDASPGEGEALDPAPTVTEHEEQTARDTRSVNRRSLTSYPSAKTNRGERLPPEVERGVNLGPRSKGGLHNICATTQMAPNVLRCTQTTTERAGQASDQHFFVALTRRRSGVRDPQRPQREPRSRPCLSFGRRIALQDDSAPEGF
jgi:hypothetical protein